MIAEAEHRHIVGDDAADAAGIMREGESADRVCEMLRRSRIHDQVELAFQRAGKHQALQVNLDRALAPIDIDATVRAPRPSPRVGCRDAAWIRAAPIERHAVPPRQEGVDFVELSITAEVQVLRSEIEHIGARRRERVQPIAGVG